MRSVVELGEDHVELRTLDSVSEANVRNLTLGGCSDKEVLLAGLQLVDELGVVGRDTVLGDFRGHGLEVEVETVDVLVANGTGSGPALRLWSKCSDKKFGKPICGRLVGEVVVGWFSSAKGEQDLLVVLTADLDALVDAWAVLQKQAVLLRVLRVRVVRSPACISCKTLAEF
jgi:hypothetical protein